MPSNSIHLDEHLKRTMNSVGYTNTGANVTFQGSLSETQFRSLIDVASATGYKVTVAAGVLTLSPR